MKNGSVAGISILLGMACLWASPGIGAVPAACDEAAIQAKLETGEFRQGLADVEACRRADAYPRLKGLAFYWLFQPDSAIVYLRQAHQQGFRDDLTLIGLAEALLWRKETRKAVPLLDKVKDKQALPFLKAMATRYEVEGDLPKALELYDRILAREKAPYIILFHKAKVLSWMMRLDESISLYTRLIQSDSVPGAFKTKCRIQRAEVMSWKKDLDPAVTELKEVVKREPGNVDALLALAEVLEWQGRFKDAKDRYKDVLLADPENRTAKQKLEKLLWVK